MTTAGRWDRAARERQMIDAGTKRRLNR